MTIKETDGEYVVASVFTSIFYRLGARQSSWAPHYCTVLRHNTRLLTQQKLRDDSSLCTIHCRDNVSRILHFRVFKCLIRSSCGLTEYLTSLALLSFPCLFEFIKTWYLCVTKAPLASCSFFLVVTSIVTGLTSYWYISLLHILL